MGVILGKRASGSIELPHGVTLTVKHADSATFELAGLIASGDAARMADGQLAAAAYGLDDEAMKAAEGKAPLSTMTIVALGRLTITAWQGVLGEDGEQAEDRVVLRALHHAGLPEGGLEGGAVGSADVKGGAERGGHQHAGLAGELRRALAVGEVDDVP